MFLSQSKKVIGNQRGLTLLELIVAVALASLIVAAVAILIDRGRTTATVSATVDRIKIITTGLAELKTFRGGLPSQGWGDFPTALQAYIPLEFRSGGVHPHSYHCVGRGVAIMTPAFDSTEMANNAVVRLVDQRLCLPTSHVTNDQVACFLVAFQNTRCM
jgi:prepilin-type N-terminal cleavage/methylation domain-containing protein